jgi:soluble lytic murein transglycosylase
MIVLLCAALTLPCAAATPSDPARAEFLRALDVAERAPLADYAAAAKPLAAHPLAAYLEYAHLRRKLADSKGARVAHATLQSFLDRHAALPIANDLRTLWLRDLIRRRDWDQYRQVYVEQQNPDLRCAALHARLAAGMDASLLDDAQREWLSGTSLPAQCDTVFLALRAAGRLTRDLHWQRIDLAAQAGNLGLIRFLAPALPATERQLAESYAAFLASASQATTTAWPRDARSRRIAVLGLNALAKRDPDAAEALFAALATPLQLDPGERGAVLNQIALWSAASYLPQSAQRFARVPDAAYDERLHEWRAREALARGDRPGTRQAIAAMPEAQRADPRWRYIDARLRETSDKAGAKSAFAALANEPSYYGFLAADRLGRDYALCPVPTTDSANARAAIAKHAGLQRAFALHALPRETWARREWDAALPSLSEAERRAAVALADAQGWYDRAVFALNRGDDLRLYQLRFPLPHARALRAEAKKNALDPAWVAALIRAESAWQRDARSHADARGLMQLLPGTAKIEATRLGLAWRGGNSLYDANTNLTLGTAHLARMLSKHAGQPYLATAAYNAGPTPVARWLAQRPPHEPDLWIETIPYRETRDYVARILAFSAIYDWRLDGKAVPVMRRMRGDIGAGVKRRAFTCPSTASVASTP